MTENKAIKIHVAENVRRIKTIEDFMRTNPDANDAVCKKNIEVLSKINGLLQEIQKYRAIGTPEELENIVCGMTEQELYREGYKKGIEECREAVEKQMEKKPILDNIYHQHYYCPNCELMVAMVRGQKPNYCEKCGQKLNWEDGGEGE